MGGICPIASCRNIGNIGKGNLDDVHIFFTLSYMRKLFTVSTKYKETIKYAVLRNLDIGTYRIYLGNVS